MRALEGIIGTALHAETTVRYLKSVDREASAGDNTCCMTTRAPLLLSVGSRVRTLRLAKGMSQEDLAARAGLHRTYVGGVERGERNVSLINLARIATALEVTLSALVTVVASRGSDDACE